jgi:cell volume regulation protein A
MIFHLVFFISVSSVLVQGTTLAFMAKLLHVSVPEKVKRKFPLDIELKDNSKSELVELDLLADSPVIGKPVVSLRLPKTALIVMIHRHNKYLTANGDTVLEKGDHLLILADNKETVPKIFEAFGVKQDAH